MNQFLECWKIIAGGPLPYLFSSPVHWSDIIQDTNDSFNLSLTYNSIRQTISQLEANTTVVR